MDEWKGASLIDEFQDWVAKRYKIKTSQSWDSILLFFSTDEYNALQLFSKSLTYSFLKEEKLMKTEVT
jgi:hypothetical protein